jgi:hypothetical protein
MNDSRNGKSEFERAMNGVKGPRPQMKVLMVGQTPQEAQVNAFNAHIAGLRALMIAGMKAMKAPLHYVVMGIMKHASASGKEVKAEALLFALCDVMELIWQEHLKNQRPAPEKKEEPAKDAKERETDLAGKDGVAGIESDGGSEIAHAPGESKPEEEPANHTNDAKGKPT